MTCNLLPSLYVCGRASEILPSLENQDPIITTVEIESVPFEEEKSESGFIGFQTLEKKFCMITGASIIKIRERP